MTTDKSRTENRGSRIEQARSSSIFDPLSSILILCVIGLLISGFWFSFQSSAAGSEENSLDPAQIRRILISSERVPEILTRVKEGILLQLPRQDFEEKVWRALVSLESAKNPPRLVEARYRATLVNSSLLGTARWKMINPVSIPGVLPLQPFNLALVKASLRKAQVDATEAIVGNLDGRSPGLLVEQPGELVANLNWSARGEAGPSGLHFDLQIPPCPVASLELDLPADMIVLPSGRDSHLLTGPFSTPNEGRSSWRIEFGGQSKVDLTVRTRSGELARHPSLILAQVQNTYDLNPEFVQAEFEFKLEIPHHTLGRPLEFELDPVLQPIEVRVSNLEAWERPSPSKLIVALKEPFQGGSVLIRCLARLGPDRTWNSPGLRLLGAIPRGETMVFRIPPDMQLENWQSGDFGLAGSDLVADGGQLLTLTVTNVSAGGNPRRPSARLNIPGPKYRVKQSAYWQIGPRGSTLTAQFLYGIETGQLFRLPLLLPTGWDVDKVELFPAELLRNWMVNEEQGRRTLMVDLQRPLTSSSFIPAGPIPNLFPRLSVWLRPAQTSEVLKTSEVSNTLPLPDIVPRGAEFREGYLAISVDPNWQARVKASVAETTPEEKGPWGRQNPDFYFAFQGKPVDGSLNLQPRRPRITARCNSDVVVTPRHIAMAIRLALQPQVPGTNSIILSLSAPVPQLRNWQTTEGSNRVGQVRRFWEGELAPALAAFGAPTILHGLNYLAVKPASSQLWLLTFDRPLSEGITLETTLDLAATSSLPSPNAEQLWDLPIPIVFAADAMEGELTLRRAGAEKLDIEATGLRPDGQDSGPETVSFLKKFRYGPSPVTLRLRRHAVNAEPPVHPVRVDHARLTTHLESQGKLINYFSFRMVNWPQHTFPIRLPEGAQPVGATVNGRWIPQLKWGETGAGAVLLELPVTAGKKLHDYQIVYAMDGPAWGPWSRVQAPPPELPVSGTLGMRRIWCLPPGVVPLGEEGLRPLPGLSEWVKEWNNAPPTPIPFQVMPLSLAETNEWADQQRRAMVEAGVRLRNELQNGGPITLGESLERLASDVLKDHRQLVLDARAFQEANLTPASTIFSAQGPGENSSPWEMLGLVYLPCKSAPLLTTRSQREAWNAVGRKDALAGSLASGITQAAIHGHDSSGRFQTVADWIQKDLPADWSPGPPATLSDSVIDPRWTEWEQLAGTDRGLVVIRGNLLLPVSFVVSLLLLLATWQTRKLATGIRWLLLLAWLTGASLALIWLPAPLEVLARWPALTGWLVAIFTVLKWSACSTAAKVKLGSPVAIGIAGICVLAIPGQAAAPAPPIVYIVPAPADAPGKETVLAPPDVLQKLQELGDGILSPRREPILLGARYHGTVAEEAADFKADFQVHSFGNGPYTFTIPLSEVTLRDALLDGAPANPTVTPAIPGRAREGFSLVIRHRGPHSIHLHFTAPVQAGGDSNKLQFRIPELAMSRLILEALPESSYPYAVAAKGAQRVTLAPASSKEKKLHLEVDLGQSSTLHVHWRPEQPKAGTIRVREAYFWDIGPLASSLYAFLHYTISRGGVTNLVLNVPEQLEVRNDPVVVKDPMDREPPPRLKDWYWSGTGQQRRLVLEFVRPVAGTLQLTLDLVPRTPFGPNAELSLPAPQGVQAPPEGGHLLAYRTQGLESQLVANLRVTGIEQDIFRNWWASSGLVDTGPDFHAFSFQREPGGPPLLRLKLSPPTTGSTAVLNVTWRLKKTQADLTATARLSSSLAELGLVEWEVPPELGIIAVAGAQVQNWSRTGSRIQVWLKGLAAETTLQLTGWVPLGQEKEDRGSRIEDRGSNPKERESKIENQLSSNEARPGNARSSILPPPSSFRLGPLRVAPAQSLTTWIRIEGDKNLVLEPDHLNGLLPLPSSVVSDREFSYLAEQNDYSGAFFVRSSPPPADRGSRIDDRRSRKNGPIVDPPSSILHPRVLLAHQEAAVVDGCRWEYQATYWLTPRTGNDLIVHFPTGAKILEATVDGLEISSLPLSVARWWVPLTARPASPVVRLRWTYEDSHLPHDRPILENPRLEELPEFTTIWTVHVPPGFVIDGPQASAQEITAGAKFLRAAEAQLQLSLWFAKQRIGNDRPEISSHLQAAQERFYRYCGLAENGLALTPASDAVLQEIRQRNRKQAEAQGFDKIRQRAEEQARRSPLGLGGLKEDEPLLLLGSLLTDQGTPTYWLVPPGSTSPRLHLTSAWQRKIQAATKVTIWTIAILLAMVVASWVPIARNFARVLGPEILMVAGCLGWWWAGPDWLFVLLIGLGVFGRLIWLIRRWATLQPAARKDPGSVIRKNDRSTPASLAGSS